MRSASAVALLIATLRCSALIPMPDANLRAWASSMYPGCIVGTSIDETHPGVVSATEIWLLSGFVQDLTGLSAFVNVTQVQISGCPLGVVDDLPPQVNHLNITDCQLTSFTAPWTLQYLNVMYNQLTSLDLMAAFQLTTLNCSHNQLTTLDLSGCGQLEWLNCTHNQLTTLTGMSGPYYSLSTIYASNNQLSAILPYPPWICSLLDISHNQFTALPQLSPNIGHTVIAHHNQITTFGYVPGNYNGLIDVSHNLIDSVPFIGHMSAAQIDLGNNPLTYVTDLPVELQVLWIDSTTLPCLPYLNMDLEELHCSGNSFTCLPNQPDDLVMSAANFGFPPAICTDVDPCYLAQPSIAMKVFLQGPFDHNTYLMDDDLRVQGVLPATEPYSAMGFTYSGNGWSDTLDPAVFSVTGADAVVDWVVVDMYPDPASSFDGNAVHYSRPALVQRDGDVTGLDGSWPLVLNMNQGKYVAAVRHRNHLGAIEKFGEWYADSTLVVDFTDWVTTICFPGALHGDSLFDDNRQLWCGDVNFDHVLKYAGTGNDRDAILLTLGGVNPTNTLYGVYDNADVNMDGAIKYTGVNNDRDPILLNVGGVTPLATRSQIGFY